MYDHRAYHKCLDFIINATEIIMVLFYIILLAFLFFTHNELLLACIIYPAATLITVSLIRKKINRPRPYDKYSLDAVHLHRHGHSFPSRHAACAIIIALMALRVNIVLGIIGIILALAVSIARILGCLHFISDVVVAAMVACAFAYLSTLFPFIFH